MSTMETQSDTGCDGRLSALGVSQARRRYALFMAAAVAGLIAAGALVTSKSAGLAVPDWPLSYGSINPPRWWAIENVRAEHGHRLIAGTVALLTVLHAVWISRRDRRPLMRKLGWLAVGAVLAQALLGGLTVLYLLPDAISVSHAALAELFFALTVSLALGSSRLWVGLQPHSLAASARNAILPLAVTTTVVIYLQILVGAVMRHTGAGLAIPTFPTVFGGVFPDSWSFPVAIHYAHRVGALVVAVLVTMLFLRCRALGAGGGSRLAGLTRLLGGLVLVQIALGGTVVLTGRAVVPNTVHVLVGALIFACSLLTSIVAWRLSAPRVSALAAAAGRPHGWAAEGGHG